MNPEIRAYHERLEGADREIAERLAREIDRGLPEAESRVWHGAPVWFLDGNPIVGYSKLKGCLRLLFWSGRSFDEPELKEEGKFQAAERRYTTADEIDAERLATWLVKSRAIQWDYKNLVKRKGRLERLS